ncbi:MAG: hypothetical protein IJX72_01150, partial [Clostridia bacterium]|nr:hypothetical protein [Clostridia bacterium]
VPTSADAQKVTEGITASELLRLMGSKAQATTGVGYTYYIWELSDGRAFCAVTEDDVLNPEQTERIVTYTYLRDSMQEMNISCAQNMETVTEGMSLATVVALLGTKYMYEGTFDISGTTWCTSTGVWWDLQVDWEIITYPETGKERAYASSVTIIK